MMLPVPGPGILAHILLVKTIEKHEACSFLGSEVLLPLSVEDARIKENSYISIMQYQHLILGIYSMLGIC